MKFTTLVSTLVLGNISGAFAVPASTQEKVSQAAPGGLGPYPATYSTDSGLTGHTIYAPANAPASLKLPVLVWGETGCSPNGRRFEAFLTQIASYGILVIANGTPDGAQENPNGIAETAKPDGKDLKAAIDWITKTAGTGKYANVDASRLAAAGQSCGGMQAHTLALDARVTVLGIFNSGQTQPFEPAPSKITKPIFYFLGGSTDIAYTNGERDYGQIPAGTPKFKGNMNVGHMATYAQANGGKFGVAASEWAMWMLRGNATASKYFLETGAGTAKGDGWDTVSSGLDAIKVTPIGG